MLVTARDLVGGAEFEAIGRADVNDAVLNLEPRRNPGRAARIYSARYFRVTTARATEAASRVKTAVPGKPLARIGGAGNGIGILAVRVGSEVHQRDIQRPHDALERRPRREVGERSGGARDAQPVDAQRERFGWFRWRVAFVENLVIRSEKLSV